MSFFLKIDADTKEAEAKIRKAAKAAGASVKKLEQQSVSAASKIKSAFTALGPIIGALGFAVVLRGLKNLVTETITFRDEIAKFSRATGTSVEFLSAIGFAAERSGANVDSMGKAFGRLARNISDAARGLVTPLEAFEVLGIEIKNVDGSLKNLEDIFPEIADGFKNMTDDTRKAALAQELFGRAGIELIPLLEEGREGIKALTDEAARLGIVFGEEAAIEAEAAADALTDFNTASNALSQNLVAELLPTLTKVTDAFTELIVAAKDPESSFGKFIKFLQDEGAAFARLNPFVGAYLEFIKGTTKETEEANKRHQEFLDIINGTTKAVEELISTVPPNAPDVPFINVPHEEMELLLPPMEEVIAGLGEAKTFSQQWAENQAALADTIPELPEEIDKMSSSMSQVASLTQSFANSLAQAAVFGGSLEDIFRSLSSSLLSFGIGNIFSNIPGFGVFGGGGGGGAGGGPGNISSTTNNSSSVNIARIVINDTTGNLKQVVRRQLIPEINRAHDAGIRIKSG